MTETPFFERRRKTRVFLLSLLLAISLIVGLATYAAAKLKEPLNSNGQAKNITIRQGTSTQTIASFLKRERIISSDKVFLYYIWAKGASKNIQAGQYELSASMTIPEIVEKLTSGKVIANEVRIRIGEGWTIEKIAQEVEATGLGKAADFYALVGSGPAQGDLVANKDVVARFTFLRNLPTGASLEGYLFPDTYIVSRPGGINELVDKMLRNFEAKVTSDILSEGRMSGRSLHSIMTMASLVEGEVGRNVTRTLTTQERNEIAIERASVSDVFWSRIEVGMALESDATISYATGKPRRQATFEDLEIQSPYNTYRNTGLPPGPINNPGLEAIKAAVNPATTNYLFFLSDTEGKTYFAETLQEHTANRRKYLPVR